MPKTGRVAWNKGMHHTEESKLKNSLAHIGTHPIISPRVTKDRAERWRGDKNPMHKKKDDPTKCPMYGKRHTEESKLKMRLANLGPKSGMWRGGTSYEPYGPEFDDKLKARVKARDGYACRICGAEENGRPHAVHHIDYDKNNSETGNLATLCISCHSTTNSNRDRWIRYFRGIQ